MRTIETNVNGTQLVLEAATKKKKLVFTVSTSEVYGKSEGSLPRGRRPGAGTDQQVPLELCGVKALDEFLALAYWRESGSQ